jgi:hypothetical protein
MEQGKNQHYTAAGVFLKNATRTARTGLSGSMRNEHEAEKLTPRSRQTQTKKRSSVVSSIPFWRSYGSYGEVWTLRPLEPAGCHGSSGESVSSHYNGCETSLGGSRNSLFSLHFAEFEILKVKVAASL